MVSHPPNSVNSGVRAGTRLARVVAVVALMLCLGWLEVWAVRTLLADFHLRNVYLLAPDAQVRAYLAAAHWRPDDATSWDRAADLISGSDPGQAKALAQHAVERSPRDWQGWASLATADFELGDVPGARAAMAQAARLNSGFEAKYRLSALALIAGDLPGFWREVKSALALAPAERVAEVLAYAAEVDPNPQRLVSILPAHAPPVGLMATQYFLKQGWTQAAAEAWLGADCDWLHAVDCVNTLLNLNRSLMAMANAAPGAASQPWVELARQAWNHGASRPWLNLPASDVGRMGEGGFRPPWLGPAFWWHDEEGRPLTAEPASLSGHGDALAISFSDQEPEQMDLLSRIVEVQPGMSYEFHFLARRDGSSSEQGIEWSFLVPPARVIATAPVVLESAWQPGSVHFSIPDGCYALEIRLRYERPLGQTLLTDTAWLAEARLEPAPGAKTP